MNLNDKTRALLFQRFYCLLLAGYVFVRTSYAWRYFSGGWIDRLFLMDYLWEIETNLISFQILRWGLLSTLILIAWGRHTRFFSALALLQYMNFFFLMSQDLNPHDDNLVVLILLAFVLVPHFSPLIAKAGLSAVYLTSGLSKLALSGWSWISGESLKIHLAQKYLETGNLFAAELMQHPWICSILASGTLIFEVSFWLVLWVRKLNPIYAVLGLMFHLSIYLVMDINFLRIYLLAYLAFLPWEDLSIKFKGKTASRPSMASKG